MFGTLTATSMVEFSGDGSFAGVNLPVDGTGVTRHTAYWTGVVPGVPSQPSDKCLKECEDLKGKRVAAGAAPSGITPGQAAGVVAVVALLFAGVVVYVIFTENSFKRSYRELREALGWLEYRECLELCRARERDDDSPLDAGLGSPGSVIWADPSLGG